MKYRGNPGLGQQRGVQCGQGKDYQHDRHIGPGQMKMGLKQCAYLNSIIGMLTATD